MTFDLLIQGVCRRMMRRVLICLVPFLTALVAHAEGPNLLTNPGFEDGEEGWTGHPQEARSVVTDARSGGQALRIECAEDVHHASAWQSVACKHGDRYLFSFWSKGEGKVNVVAWFKGADGNDIEAQRPYLLRKTVVGAHDWSRSGMVIHIPESCMTVNVTLYVGQGHAVFDDVELMHTDMAGNILLNGGMEVSSIPPAPDGWLRTLKPPGPPEHYSPERWGIDATQPWEGRSCVKLTVERVGVHSIFAPCQAGCTYTFSVYLRADHPMRAGIFLWTDRCLGEVLDVGTQWERHSFTATMPDGMHETHVAVTHRSAEGTLWVDGAQLELGNSASPWVASFRDLPVNRPDPEPGQVAVEIPEGAVELLGISEPPHTGSAIAFDRERECLLVDGRPWFGIGFWGVPGVGDHFGELAAHGCNFAIMLRSLYGNVFPWADWTPEEGVANARACLDRAQAAGVRVIPVLAVPADGRMKSAMNDADFETWYTDEGKRAWLDLLINHLKDHPALLAWLFSDEPHTVAAEWVERLHRFVRERDPDHPAFLNLGGGKTTAGSIESYGPFTDLSSVDCYPAVLHGTLEPVPQYADVLRSSQPGKPLMYHTECYIPDAHWYRSPTVEEQRAAAYLAVIHGASMISYFTYRPASQHKWDATREMNAELRTIADEYGLLEPPAPGEKTIAESDGIHALVKGDENRVVLITANARNRPAEVRFNIPGLPGTWQVRELFGDNTPEWENGGFQDHFDPYDRHVYILE